MIRPEASSRAAAVRDINTELISAADWGDLVKVRTALRGGADPNASDGSPLVHAARNGHRAVVRCLLDAGADANGGWGLALRGAAVHGDDVIVGLLLDAGANVHAFNDSALTRAIASGHASVVRLLVGAGADVSARDSYALRAAIEYGRPGCVEALLKAGAPLTSSILDSLNADDSSKQGIFEALIKSESWIDVATFNRIVARVLASTAASLAPLREAMHLRMAIAPYADGQALPLP